MKDDDSISLAAERAADWLRARFKGGTPEAFSKVFIGAVDDMDAARVLLQDYEVAEQDIREQVAGTIHEQPATLTGPRYLRAVFESMRVASVRSDGSEA